MENFLNQISQISFTDAGTDLETIKKWPSTEVQSDLISDTQISVRTPGADISMLDYRRFNLPSAPGLKVKRKGKVSRHLNLADNDNNVGI